MTDIVVLSSVGFTPSPSPDSERSRWGFALVEESSFADRGSMSRQSTVRLIECRKSNKKNGKKEPLAGPFAFLLLRRVGRLHFLDGWSLSRRPVSCRCFSATTMPTDWSQLSEFRVDAALHALPWSKITISRNQPSEQQLIRFLLSMEFSRGFLLRDPVPASHFFHPRLLNINCTRSMQETCF